MTTDQQRTLNGRLLSWGALVVAFAATMYLVEVGALDVQWSQSGPLVLVALGAVAILLGGIGILLERRRMNPPDGS